MWFAVGEYACAKYLGVGKNDCVNTKHERVIVNTKRKQVIMRGKLLQFKVIQINLLSSGRTDAAMWAWQSVCACAYAQIIVALTLYYDNSL